MNNAHGRRAGAAAGLASIACSLVAVVFERGAVDVHDPAGRIAAHFSVYATALRMQVVLFGLGLAFLLWFLAALAAQLRRGAPDFAGNVAAGAVLAAGAVSVGLTAVALALQAGLATVPDDAGVRMVVGVMNAVFTLSGLALAVVLGAVGVLAARRTTFPSWVAWLSGAAAVTQLLPVAGIVVDSGPLASGGWLSAYLPYPLYAAWVVAVAVLLLRADRNDRGDLGGRAADGPASDEAAPPRLTSGVVARRRGGVLHRHAVLHRRPPVTGAPVDRD